MYSKFRARGRENLLSSGSLQMTAAVRARPSRSSQLLGVPIPCGWHGSSPQDPIHCLSPYIYMNVGPSGVARTGVCTGKTCWYWWLNPPATELAPHLVVWCFPLQSSSSYCLLFVYPCAAWGMSGLQFLVIVDEAAVSVCVRVCTWTEAFISVST